MIIDKKIGSLPKENMYVLTLKQSIAISFELLPVLASTVSGTSAWKILPACFQDYVQIVIEPFNLNLQVKCEMNTTKKGHNLRNVKYYHTFYSTSWTEAPPVDVLPPQPRHR